MSTREAILQQARDLLFSELSTEPVITTFNALVLYAQTLPTNPHREELFVLYLDTKNRLRASVRHQTGSHCHVPAKTPRLIIKEALQQAASALILLRTCSSPDRHAEPASDAPHFDLFQA